MNYKIFLTDGFQIALYPLGIVKPENYRLIGLAKLLDTQSSENVGNGMVEGAVVSIWDGTLKRVERVKMLPENNSLHSIGLSANKNANQKGFWEEGYNLSEKLMLIVSEIAEAQEADRKDHFADLQGFEKHFADLIHEDYEQYNDLHFQSAFEQFVKNTFEDEMADTLIRVLDLCCQRGIDIEEHVRLKMKYNSLRPYKHGKKY